MNTWRFGALLLLVLPVLCSAATYYCNPAADAGGNGTTAALTGANCAFKTVEIATYAIPDGGGPLKLATGTYASISLTSASGYPARTQYLTIEPDTAATPVITFLYIANGNVHWWLKWHNLTFLRQVAGTNVIEAIAGAYLDFDGCTVTGLLAAAPGDPRYRSDYCSSDGILLFQASLNNVGCHDITIQNCTLSQFGHCAIHMHTDGLGGNINVLYNDISLCGCNGITPTTDPTKYPNGPSAMAPYFHGNYIHDQAVVWKYDYTEKAHGSGFYINSPLLTINGNEIHSFGSTSGIRTYPTPSTIEFKNITITNNLIINPVNTFMEFYNISSGCKVNHNTCVGSDNGGSGLTKFYNGDNQSTMLRFYENASFDHSDFEFCNNIFLGFCGPAVAVSDGAIFSPTGHFVGNIFWSTYGATTQTWVNANYPGNTILCDSADDSNSVDLTTGGSYFAGGAWFNANAFERSITGTFSHSAGEPGTSGHAFDLVAGASAVNYGSNTYTATADFWGTERTDGHPDSGYYEVGGGSPPNNAPVLDAIGAKSISELRTLTFAIHGTDDDSDPLTYSADDLPTGATFVSPTFTWTPTDTQVGSYVVYFEVTDGTDTDFENVTITVGEAIHYMLMRQ
jgi:hypothetical protein